MLVLSASAAPTPASIVSEAAAMKESTKMKYLRLAVLAVALAIPCMAIAEEEEYEAHLHDFTAIYAATVAMMADKNCPHMKLNEHRLDIMLNERVAKLHILDEYNKNPQLFCERAWGYIGPKGTSPYYLLDPK
jgi:hypothetical protein